MVEKRSGERGSRATRRAVSQPCIKKFLRDQQVLFGAILAKKNKTSETKEEREKKELGAKKF